MCWVHASERLSLIHFGKASRGNCQGQNRNREIRPSGLAGGPRKRDFVGYDSVRASRFYPDGLTIRAAAQSQRYQVIQFVIVDAARNSVSPH
jgi:hypothetical protein